MKQILTLFFIVMLSFSVHSQWTTVGTAGFSNAPIGAIFISVNSANIPHVIFRDAYTKISVMKFDGANWVYVGSPGFSAPDSDCATITFDNNDTPYVAFMDGTGAQSGRKATVMKFDGANWVPVGAPRFTQSPASYTSIKIDQYNTPYVAFRDCSKNYRASVMKFDGVNWVYVGNPGFSALGNGFQGAAYTSLAIDKNGILYVGYTDHSNDFKASVMKFNGISWEYVGTPGFSVNGTANTSLVIDSNGTPYIAYSEGKATVMKFDGSNWVPVGIAGFTPSDADFTSLAIDKNNKLYITYKDYATSVQVPALTYNGFTWAEKASAMTFDGTNWVQLGNAGFSGTIFIILPLLWMATEQRMLLIKMVAQPIITQLL